MEFHPIANIFPMMGDEELGELADDIMESGLYQPIVMYEGKILDGRNRYRAWCDYCGADELPRECFEDIKIYPSGEPAVTDYEGDDPLSYVLSLNLHRRHLTASQRAALAAEIANLDMGRPEKNSAKLQSLSRSEAAEKLDVSARYVNEAKKIQRESPEHFDKVKSGELSLQQAKREITIGGHGVEIKSISDFDKAAAQSPEVKAVNAWHNIYNAQRKIVVDFHRIYNQIGKEPLCQTLRENDMMGDCDDMLAWVEKTVGFIEEVRSER